MPAQSEKQVRLFRLVRGVQKGDVKPSKVSPQVRKMASTIKPSSVKDFTKVKEIIKKLKEDSETQGAEYTLSKAKEITDKPFDQVLRENVGVPFDEKVGVLLMVTGVVNTPKAAVDDSPPAVPKAGYIPLVEGPIFA